MEVEEQCGARGWFCRADIRPQSPESELVFTFPQATEVLVRPKLGSGEIILLEGSS